MCGNTEPEFSRSSPIVATPAAVLPASPAQKNKTMAGYTNAERIAYLNAEAKTDARNSLMRGREQDVAIISTRNDNILDILRDIHSW